MQWLRYYHETPTDPKWRAVAIEAGVPVHAVLAVWDCMMVNASNSSVRGTLEGWNHRVVGAAIDLKGAEVEAIHAAMQGLTLDGDRLTGWDKRQRGSDDSATRVKQHREKVKRGRNVTSVECNVTATEGSRDVTDFPLRAQITDSDLELTGMEEPNGSPIPGADAPSLLDGLGAGDIQRQPKAATSKPMPAASASDTPEKRLFDRGKEVLGSSAGGMIAKLRKKLDHDDEHALRTINLAAEKQNPREWIGRLLAGDASAETDDYAAEVRRRNQEWGVL